MKQFELEPPTLEELVLPPATKDLVLLLKTLEFGLPCTPKCHCSYELLCDNFGCLFPPVIGAFMLEHIINHLLMNLFMMWNFCQINEGWHKVTGNTVL